jgi:hypothetical protein
MEENDQPSADDLNLYREVENSPAGSYKMFIATGAGIEENINQHMQNIRELKIRINHANSVNCFIEVISIRLQIIDYWLRLFYSSKAKSAEKREREFGRFLKQSFDLGLDKNLYDKLLKFNMHRINAIHGYVIGTISYETINKVALESNKLLKESVEFVVLNSGKIVTSRDQLAANPGALTLPVKWFCNQIRMGNIY